MSFAAVHNVRFWHEAALRCGAVERHWTRVAVMSSGSDRPEADIWPANLL